MSLLSLKGTPNHRQAEFFKATARHIGYGGARGGGKSWAMRRKFVLLALRYPALKLLLLRRTHPELRENHIIPLLAEIGQATKYNDDEKAFRFPNGSRLKLGYCENENDVYQYQGQEYDVLGLEEATHFTEAQRDFLITCNRNVRTDFKPRAYYTGNPGNVGHAWFKRLFVDRLYRNQERAEDHVFIPAKVYDNSVLMERNPEYVRDLENLPYELREAHLNGNWDVFIGQVFAEWNRDTHVVPPFEIPKHWRRWGANDPGFTDPAVWYWFAADEDGNVYCYREYWVTRKTHSVQAQEVRTLTKEEPIDFWVTGMDAFVKNSDTGKSPVDYYRDGGVTGFIEPDHGAGAKSRRVQVMHEYLRPFVGPHGKTVARLRIFNTCEKLIETLPKLLQDPKRHEEVIRECADDHWFDAAGYGVQAWHAKHSTGVKKIDRNTLGAILEHESVVGPPPAKEGDGYDV